MFTVVLLPNNLKKNNEHRINYVYCFDKHCLNISEDKFTVMRKTADSVISLLYIYLVTLVNLMGCF